MFVNVLIRIGACLVEDHHIFHKQKHLSHAEELCITAYAYLAISEQGDFHAMKGMRGNCEKQKHVVST